MTLKLYEIEKYEALEAELEACVISNKLKDDVIDTRGDEIERLEARVAELEGVFIHTHKHDPNKSWLNDSCAKCGLDLRDRIHTRVALGGDDE